MGSISSTNATFVLQISALFPSPQQLQGWSVDDAFDTEPLDSAEVLMGVDGLLSGGFVFVPFKQTISLQADSPSNAIFDTWYLAQQQIRDVYIATGIIRLPAIGKSYAMTQGFLTRYPPIADVKKTLQPRRYGVTWQLGTPSNS